MTLSLLFCTRNPEWNSPYRQLRDLEGPSLVSGGDTDLALTACDTGSGAGIFRTLVVRHLISRHRVEPQYIVRLAENIAVGPAFG